MATTVSNRSALLFVTCLMVFLCTIIGKLGSFYWLFDLFSHFTIQYLYASGALLALLLLRGQRNYAGLALAVASIVLNSMSLSPLYWQTEAMSMSGRDVRIASININSLNNNWPALRNYLDNYQPDVVTFFELTPEWGNKINTLRQIFPYGKAILQTNNFGIGIVSKLPLNNIQIHRETDFELPFVAADIELQNIPITIVAAHPFPPIGSIGTRIRNDYLARVAEFIRDNSSPTILCGDLNITPWSSHFRSVIEVAHLALAEGHGIVTTWPTYFPLLRIPIDHCLASPSIQIISYSRGPNIGSDHYPLEVVITLDSNRIPSSK